MHWYVWRRHFYNILVWRLETQKEMEVIFILLLLDATGSGILYRSREFYDASDLPLKTIIFWSKYNDLKITQILVFLSRPLNFPARNSTGTCTFLDKRDPCPGRLYGRGTNPCVTCWKVPYIGLERGKLREVNPVSAINTGEEKSGRPHAEVRGNSTPPPHMVHSPRILSGSSRVPGHWEA